MLNSHKEEQVDDAIGRDMRDIASGIFRNMIAEGIPLQSVQFWPKIGDARSELRYSEVRFELTVLAACTVGVVAIAVAVVAGMREPHYAERRFNTAHI
jgi:hypothetical protein